MKILILTDSYPPEIRSASTLIHELRVYLHKLGHQTDVVTTEARYNIDESWDFKEVNGLSQPIHVKTLPHHNVSFVLRGIAQLIMPLQFYLAVRKSLKEQYDLCIIYSPPLTLGLVGIFLKKTQNLISVMNVQDLFPKNAIDLGILRNRFLIKFFEKIEKICYEKNDIITFHSINNLMQAKLKLSKEKNDKFMVLHNWINVSTRHSPEQGYVREKYNIPSDRNIAIFAGVIGPAQGLEAMIAIAEKAQASDLNWQFLILGDGSEREKIATIVKMKGLSNVQIENFVSQSEYRNILAGCELGLVCLSGLNKTPVVPGKLLEYMAQSKPVFCLANPESDIHQIVAAAGAGRSLSTALVNEEIWEQFSVLVADKEKLMEYGASGYAYASEHFAVDKVIQKLLNRVDEELTQ